MMEKNTEKERLDILLVEKGLADSREKAKAAIMAGIVFVNDERMEKAGMKVAKDANIRVKGAVHPYVGRGGLKLEHAIKQFELDLTDAVMLDIGSSTGGFTDCALQHGAAFVYAIDVGYNQLDWSLRQDSRVCVMERTNFRYMKPDDLKGPKPNLASIDVSFISLKKIFPPLQNIFLTNGSGMTVALVKPQFEAGREYVGKSGIVREKNVHIQVLLDLYRYFEETGWSWHKIAYSPIKGGEGNIEFLALLSTGETQLHPEERVTQSQIRHTVEQAHRML